MLVLTCHRYLAAYLCRLNSPRPPWDLGEVFSLLSKTVMKVLEEFAQPQYPALLNPRRIGLPAHRNRSEASTGGVGVLMLDFRYKPSIRLLCRFSDNL